MSRYGKASDKILEVHTMDNGKSSLLLGGGDKALSVSSYVTSAECRDESSRGHLRTLEWYRGLAIRISRPGSNLRRWGEGCDLSQKEVEGAISAVKECLDYGQYTTSRTTARVIRRCLLKLLSCIRTGRVPQPVTCKGCERRINRSLMNKFRICKKCVNRFSPKPLTRRLFQAKPGTKEAALWSKMAVSIIKRRLGELASDKAR